MRYPVASAVAILVAVTAPAGLPPRAQAGTDVPARLVAEVERGLAAADARWAWKGWYRDRPEETAWSSAWDAVHLLEARVGLQVAAPSREHRQLLIGIALRAERYYDPKLAHGLGGFTTGYADTGEQGTMYYDDDGWLGLAFFDAYAETGMRRFLRDARIAFRFMYRAGWDPVGGGIWWNSRRTVKCAESVNTAALLAVELYDATHEPSYLRAARRLVDWADAHLLDKASGLYANHPVNGVLISYNQSPMLVAMMRLCRAGRGYCARVAPLRAAMLREYGPDLHQPPQYDAMYLRYLTEADRLQRDPKIQSIVLANAARIEENAVDGGGYYLRGWDGTMAGIAPGLVSVHGAALEALAWAAVAARP